VIQSPPSKLRTLDICFDLIRQHANDALKQKHGKLHVSVVLWDYYDLLAVYSANEVLIACPERFVVSTVGANSCFSTLGAPDCIVDYCCADWDQTDGEAKANRQNVTCNTPPARPDILIILTVNFQVRAAIKIRIRPGPLSRYG